MNQLTTKEQRLFLRLILLGTDSWDRDSLYKIQSWIGAAPHLDDYSIEQYMYPLEGYPILCAGCGSKVRSDITSSYPTIVERCSSCNPKPLRAYNNSAVHRGVAKLSYIDQAMYFPTIEDRNIAIHEALSCPSPP